MTIVRRVASVKPRGRSRSRLSLGCLPSHFPIDMRPTSCPPPYPLRAHLARRSPFRNGNESRVRLTSCPWRQGRRPETPPAGASRLPCGFDDLTCNRRQLGCLWSAYPLSIALRPREVGRALDVPRRVFPGCADIEQERAARHELSAKAPSTLVTVARERPNWRPQARTTRARRRGHLRASASDARQHDGHQKRGRGFLMGKS